MRIGTCAAAALLFILSSEPVLAFSVPTHEAITSDILNTVTVPINGLDTKFSILAVNQIAKANGDVDTLTPAYFFPYLHFTNSAYIASASAILVGKLLILSRLETDPPDGDTARILLGATLHTIQDFYAHSNWVERGHTTINTNLGHSITSPDPPSSNACPVDRNMLGTGGGGGFTSGWFGDIIQCGCNPYYVDAGDCFHGNYRPLEAGLQQKYYDYVCEPLGFLCRGINKDLSPGEAELGETTSSPSYDDALLRAHEATLDFVQQITGPLIAAHNDAALQALVGSEGSMGLVIDTTGSMGDIIDGVKVIAKGLVDFANSNPFTRPDQWVMEPFNDPGYGPPVVSPDPKTIEDAIDALTASGGGDCPELSQHGILEALGNVSTKSRLFVFTDASAKDAYLINDVVSQAQAKKSHINYLISGNCGGDDSRQNQHRRASSRTLTPSSADPVYQRGASETGGQLFVVQSSEVNQLLPLFTPQVGGDLTTIFSSDGTLQSDTPRRLRFPIDSTVSQLVISASIDQSTIVTLRRPDGTIVKAGDPGVTLIQLSASYILTLATPTPGSWRIDLVGSTPFTINISGNSGLDLASFDFVEPGDDIHGGYLRIAGQPITGSHVMGLAKLMGPYQSASFKVVDPTGHTLRGLSLKSDSLRLAADEFLGDFDLPTVPFRVLLTGKDKNGFAYQRQLPVIFRGQTSEVRVKGGQTSFLPSAVTTSYYFNVVNHGPSGTFLISASDSNRFVVSVNPASIALDTGASQQVRLDMLAPSTTANGTSDLTTVTATSASNSLVFNSARLSLAVASTAVLGDVNADGVVDCADISVVKATFGSKAGKLGFDPRADVVHDEIIDIHDLSFVAQKLPSGTVCN